MKYTPPCWYELTTPPAFNGPWYNFLYPYVKNWQLFKCPSDNTSYTISYAVQYGNGASYGFGYADLYPPRPMGEIVRPAEVMAITESNQSYYIYSPVGWPINGDADGDGLNDTYSVWVGTASTNWYNHGAPFRHNGGYNAVFFDGHVKWVQARNWLGDMRMWNCNLP